MAIRVLYYIPHLQWGGGERYLVNLTSHLDRRRFLPSVWCSGMTGPVTLELERAGVEVHTAPLPEDVPDGENASVPFLRDGAFDILHSCNHRKHCLEVLAARRARVPVVLIRRGNMRHWDPADRIRDWEIRRNQLVDMVVANCESVARMCESVEQVERARIRVIHNGIDASVPPSAPAALRTMLEWTRGELILGSVGNMRRVKGHDVLLQAFQMVAEKFPEARLAICGSDYGELDSLSVLRDRLRLTEKVAFVTLEPDAGPFYADCDIYVQSSWSEGMSNATMEAMRAGVPVIATDVGGTSEVIHQGETGILTPPGDPQALAAALAQLLRDTELRSRLGQAGRTTLIRRFSLARMVRAHEALYEELLHAR